MTFQVFKNCSVEQFLNSWKANRILKNGGSLNWRIFVRYTSNEHHHQRSNFYYSKLLFYFSSICLFVPITKFATKCVHTTYTYFYFWIYFIDNTKLSFRAIGIGYNNIFTNCCYTILSKIHCPQFLFLYPSIFTHFNRLCSSSFLRNWKGSFKLNLIGYSWLWMVGLMS